MTEEEMEMEMEENCHMLITSLLNEGAVIKRLFLTPDERRPKCEKNYTKAGLTKTRSNIF
jgi:hypothetical protein